MKKALCLLCVKPHPLWIQFLSDFKEYDVFLVVDDNSVEYSLPIKTIQIPDDVCRRNGFQNLNFTVGKSITAWEKALYFFSQTSYDSVWFLEDDVFLYDESTLVAIDTLYPTSDLLTNNYGENLDGKSQEWHWSKIKIELPPPYFCAMVCATRMSNTLLKKLKEYASSYKTLFFLEACFSTLCMHHHLQYDTPKELWTVMYKKQYKMEDYAKINLYHPLKDISLHSHIRNFLANM